LIISPEEQPSFKSGIYQRSIGNEQYEYVIAFAGTFTDDKLIYSLTQDLLQVVGQSFDMQLAIKLGVEASSLIQDSELTFVGHSKGGAEATGAAIYSNREALTYNSAKINVSGMPINDYLDRNPNGIINYVAKADPISHLNYSNISTVMLVGIIKTIDTHQSPAIAHSIKYLKEALKPN